LFAAAALVTLRGRAAWAHNFNTDRSLSGQCYCRLLKVDFQSCHVEARWLALSASAARSR
jgi:uncharacterized protein with beta-barrel porin domain